MANYRIDVLKFVYDGTTKTYNVTGTCNSGGGNALPVEGRLSRYYRQVEFELDPAVKHTDEVTFSFTGLNFNSLLAPDMFDLVFVESQVIPPLGKKKASISICDTPYPPPTPAKGVKDDDNHAISSAFIIQELTFTRKGTSNDYNDFDVDIKMGFTMDNYRLSSYSFETDPNNEYDAILLRMDDTAGSSPFTVQVHSPVSGWPLDLSAYPNGLPIIIADRLMGWDKIVEKKIMVYID